MKVPEFYCEPIQVETNQGLHFPAAFTWRGKRHVVCELVQAWQDWGFGRSQLRNKNWRLRHHRNYFVVRTDSDEVFKIYCDRGAKMSSPRQWVLLTKER
ncbi:MAG: DUF6504 family protein [Dehalococcoidia bacterium]